MNKKHRSDSTPYALAMPNLLRAYDAQWKGHLVLACRKCQKKLKSSHDAFQLKKALAREAK